MRQSDMDQSDTDLNGRAEQSPPSGGRRATWIARLIVIGAFCVLGGGLWALVSYLLSVEVHGALHASGEAIGTWTLTPDDCQSGEHQGFFGVSLFSKADTRLGVSIIKDPTRGYLVDANIPGSDRALTFENCPIRGDVHRTSSRVNDIWNVSGSIDVACSTDDAAISGHVEFAGCH
jgi:hypothetical protein